MKFIDLFAGIGGFRTGLEANGHECVAFCEIDKHARQSYRAIHDTTNEDEYHDITKITDEEWAKYKGKVDIICGGFPCFEAGTLIQTNKGLVPIENITKEHSVLTHKNRYRKVVVPMIKNANKVLKIKVTGSLETKVTEEHPYYVVEKTWEYDKQEKRMVRKYSKPKWVNAEDLEVGVHLVGYAVDKEEKNPLNITKEEAYIIGRYIADGYLNVSKRAGRENSYNNKVIICVGKHKLEEFASKIKTYHFGHYEDKTTYKSTATSKRLVELCGKVGRGADNKQIPYEYLALPTELLAELLNGYFSGDGGEREGLTYAVTVSRKLALSLSQAVRKTYKLPVSIDFVKTPDKTVIEGREVNQKDWYRVSYRKNANKSTSAVVGGIVFSPVKSIEESIEDITVYNMEVEEDNSYTANGTTVHNCQTFSIAGKRRGIEDTRGTLFFDIARGASIVKPKYLFLENVKGLLSSRTAMPYEEIVSILGEGTEELWGKEKLTPLKDYETVIDNISKYLVDKVDLHKEVGEVSVDIKEGIGINNKLKLHINSLLTKLNQDCIEELEISKVEELYNSIKDLNDTEVVNELKIVLYVSKQYLLKTNVWNKFSTNLNKNLSKLQGGNYYVKTFNIITSKLDELGYDIQWDTFNSADYGVAQNRERVFIIGLLRDSGATEVLPVQRTHRVSTGEGEVKAGDYRYDEGFRIRKNGLSPTLTATMGSSSATNISGSRLIFEPNGKIRIMTELEAWRLQGFTDEQFNKAKKDGVLNSQLYKQAGNSVSVPVISAIAKGFK